MLTDNKEISTPSYWDRVYSGQNNGAKVDASDTKRTITFDRFDIVVAHAEGKHILDIGSGHGHICKRIAKKLPQSEVIASDQAPEARKVANYEPYMIFSGYEIPFPVKYFDLVICSQAMEYIEDQEQFLTEVKRVSKKFICTVPKGEMKSWSQLRIYTPENLIEFLIRHGSIEIFEDHDSLMLAKIKFND